MAKTKEVKAKVTVETEVKGLDAVKQKFGEIKKYAQDIATGLKNPETRFKTLGKLAKDFGGAVQKAAQKGVGAVKKLAGGFGNVAKSIGKLGIITAIGGAITGVFSKNQKVVDAFNKVITTVSIIFSQIAEAIFGVFEEQSQLNGGFDATKKVLGGLISGVLNIFLGTLQTIKLGVLIAQRAWEDSFFGDGDTEKIKALTEEINNTKEALKETGQAILESGKQVVNNFTEAVGEIGNATIAVVDGVTKAAKNIDVKKATQQAERLVELQKAAALADAERQKIQLQFQTTAEELRQLRDDESKSIADRQQANADLLATLEEQAKLEAEQVKIKIANAAATFNLTQNQEDLVALKQAELELTDLNERITGQRSEALVNENSLKKEQLAIDQSIIQANLEILETQLTGNAELEKDSIKRLNMELANLDIIRNAKIQAIDDELAATAAGTARYQELLNQKALIDEQYRSDKAAKEKERDDETKKRQKQNAEALFNLTNTTLSAISQIADAYAGDDEAKKKKAFELSKKLEIGQAIINTYTGITAALASEELPLFARIAGAVGVAVTGFANVAKIRATQYGSGSGDASAAEVTPVNPNTAFFGGTAGNNTISRKEETPVFKTYVLESDVTSAQNANKRIKDRARL